MTSPCWPPFARDTTVKLHVRRAPSAPTTAVSKNALPFAYASEIPFAIRWT
jgi:hypothetical protein